MGSESQNDARSIFIMKRVLIITYYWPPSGGSGVQRWVKFAKYLPEDGWQPVVYTPENPELTTVYSTLAAEIPPEAEVVKNHIFEPYGIYRKLMGKGSTTDLKTLTAANAVKDIAGVPLHPGAAKYYKEIGVLQ